MIGSHVGRPRAVSASKPVRAATCMAAAAASAQAAGGVAERIYRQELEGSGARTDQQQVEHYAPLLRALAREDRAAVRESVTQLVFSHTHIVRLRVISNGGLSVDVGGPFVIAPVAGVLRLRGHVVGRYLLSVQDDVGYVKLETRFVGVPVALFAGGAELPLEGSARIADANLARLTPLTYRGAPFDAYSFAARAFPTGRLRIALLVPPDRGAATMSCAAIRATELGVIGARIWGRYALASAPPATIVNAIARLTGALAYVRAGSARLASSTRLWPSALPTVGTTSFRGRAYEVRSFAATVSQKRVRAYLLF